MPGYKGHLVGGSAAFGITYFLLSSHCSTTMIAVHWLLCSLAGSLFPDIDVKSKGQKYGYWAIFFLFILLILSNQLRLLSILSLVCLTPMLVRHRGIFHRMWFVILMPLGVWLGVSTMHPQWSGALFFYTLFFIVGCASHLVLDFGIRRLKW
jgi:hypothetical protein